MTRRTRNIPTGRSPATTGGVRRFFSPLVLGSLGLVLLIGLIAYAVYAAVTDRSALAQPIEGLEQFPNQAGGHVEGPVTYAQTPPVGGEHNPVWQNCGVYTEPVPSEQAVHSLEHGAIWIAYQPELPADQVAALQRITRQSGYRLLSPFPGLPSPIVASAWGYQLKLDSADDARLARFIEKYEQNPLGPEPGASCSGGTGSPN